MSNLFAFIYVINIHGREMILSKYHRNQVYICELYDCKKKNCPWSYSITVEYSCSLSNIFDSNFNFNVFIKIFLQMR